MILLIATKVAFLHEWDFFALYVIFMAVVALLWISQNIRKYTPPRVQLYLYSTLNSLQNAVHSKVWDLLSIHRCVTTAISIVFAKYHIIADALYACHTLMCNINHCAFTFRLRLGFRVKPHICCKQLRKQTLASATPSHSIITHQR